MTELTPKPLVLVTGGTGLVGSHTVLQLLEQGYPVRAVVRKPKIESFKKTYPNAGAQLEVVEMSDFVNGDFGEALKNVSALLHIAAPTYMGNSNTAEILKTGIEGTVNIIRQAIKAGIKQIVATSSEAALVDSEYKRQFSPEELDENSWNPITIEEINTDAHSPAIVYMGSKTLAEQKVWELADQNPDVDFTTILPPAIYGGLVPNFPRPKEIGGLSTLEYPGQLVRGGSGPNTWPVLDHSTSVHVSDVAKAHILAIHAPPLKDGRHKRLIVCNGQFSWPDSAELIRKERPELAHRLPPRDLPAPKQGIAPVSTRLTEEVLGLKEWIPWQVGILEAVDAVVEWEKGL